LSSSKFFKLFLGQVANKERQSRKPCVNQDQLVKLDNLVYQQRDLTANKLKIATGISAATRTIRKYLNLLGWHKRKTGFCQFVSYKNRIERVAYAKACLKFNETFQETVFIDESTIKCNKNGNMQWYRKNPGETKNGLVGKYKHETCVHVIGGISRKGPTNLIIFKGNMKAGKFGWSWLIRG
jgi:hypothetical protein